MLLCVPAQCHRSSQWGGAGCRRSQQLSAGQRTEQLSSLYPPSAPACSGSTAALSVGRNRPRGATPPPATRRFLQDGTRVKHCLLVVPLLFFPVFVALRQRKYEWSSHCFYHVFDLPILHFEEAWKLLDGHHSSRCYGVNDFAFTANVKRSVCFLHGIFNSWETPIMLWLLLLSEVKISKKPLHTAGFPYD